MAECITRKVQIVTLAFPGGAENQFTGHDDPEFDGVRPSMIVYGMRWWFRALAGAIRGTDDLESIRTAESAIFGTSQNIKLNGQEFQGLSSRVRVTILENIASGERFEKEDPRLWLKYLAYGLFPTDSSDAWVRKYVREGAQFQFRLQVSPPRGEDSKEPVISKELIESLADLWIELGGLGARWRHGLGGMRIAESPDLKNGIQYPQQVRKRINDAKELVKDFLGLLGLPDPKPHPPLPSFPVVQDPHFQLAWRLNAGHDAMAALETVHLIWRGMRKTSRGNAYSSSRNAALYRQVAAGGSLAGYQAEFAGLGLPIPFGFPQMHPRRNGALVPEFGARRASPIWFRVIRVNDKQYGLLAMLWNCVYLPKGEGVAIGLNEGAKVPVPCVPDDAAAWFEGLLKSPQDRFIRG